MAQVIHELPSAIRPTSRNTSSLTSLWEIHTRIPSTTGPEVNNPCVDSTNIPLTRPWSDLALRTSKGVDGFALDVGRDCWQAARVADVQAFVEARKNTNNHFWLFILFDAISLPCKRAAETDILRCYTSTYEEHPNYLKYHWKMMVSTFNFEGEDCRFGATLGDSATLCKMEVVDCAFDYNVRSNPLATVILLTS